MKAIFPPKLKKGDLVRIISPSTSVSAFTQQVRDDAVKAFEDMGLKVSFGKNAWEMDAFFSSPVKSRVEDLHDAFSDPEVKAIFAAWGGFNAGEMLNQIDYELIRKNPKIFSGYSDITTLCNAINAKTGLVTYLGADFSHFALGTIFGYTLEQAKKLFFEGATTPLKLEPAKQCSQTQWSADKEYKQFFDKDKVVMQDNPGPYAIKQGRATGKIVAGNLRTLLLLQGTPFMPDLKDSILFVEEATMGSGARDLLVFERNVRSLAQSTAFSGVKGLVFGRFEKGFFGMQDDKDFDLPTESLEVVLSKVSEIKNIPIIADIDFGHSNPTVTVPVGGQCKIEASESGCKIELTEF